MIQRDLGDGTYASYDDESSPPVHEFTAVLAAYGVHVIHGVVTHDASYPYHGGLPDGTLCGDRVAATRNKFDHIKLALRCKRCQVSFGNITEVGTPSPTRRK